MIERTEPGGAGRGGTARRLLDGVRAPPGAAAFANAGLLHARIQEDAHPAGHVGVVVLPAALAAAEHTGADGETLLAAVVAGYETALRIGRDHAAAASRRGFRTTPLYGVVGAAAAAARLHRLSPERTADALALAANLAGGLREFAMAGTDEYALHAGSAARNGLTAAWCAAEGVRGAPTSLEGPAGFFRAFGEEPGVRPDERITEALGESFEMLAVTGKRWPICQFHRGIVRGLVALRREAMEAASGEGGAPGRRQPRGKGAGRPEAREAEAGAAPPVRGIRLKMNPFEADFFGVRRTGPFESFAHTFMSAPFCAALAWVEGTVTLAAMHDFSHPGVRELAGRIEVIASPEIARYRPRVEAVLVDGRELARQDPGGDDALDWASAERMAAALMAESGVPKEVGARLARTVDALDRGGAVGSVVEAACTAARLASAEGQSSAGAA